MVLDKHNFSCLILQPFHCLRNTSLQTSVQCLWTSHFYFAFKTLYKLKRYYLCAWIQKIISSIHRSFQHHASYQNWWTNNKLLTIKKWALLRYNVASRGVESESGTYPVLLLDCTLSLVLCHCSRRTVLASHATSRAFCHHTTLFASTLLYTFY